MKLFAPDLYRNFLFGFLGAGLVLAAGVIPGIQGFGSELVPEARAAEAVAPVADDIVIDDAFVIAEIDESAS